MLNNLHNIKKWKQSKIEEMHMQTHNEVQTQAFHFYCDVRNLLKRNEKYPA